MKNTLIDAGPIIALFDRDDRYHESVLHFTENYIGKFITTWPVITEASHMLDFHKQVQLDFLSWVYKGGVEIYLLKQWHLESILKMMEKYADMPADLADVTLLIVADELNIEEIISIDRDFDIYRQSDGKSLRNTLC